MVFTIQPLFHYFRYANGHPSIKSEESTAPRGASKYTCSDSDLVPDQSRTFQAHSIHIRRVTFKKQELEKVCCKEQQKIVPDQSLVLEIRVL